MIISTCALVHFAKVTLAILCQQTFHLTVIEQRINTVYSPSECTGLTTREETAACSEQDSDNLSRKLVIIKTNLKRWFKLVNCELRFTAI